MKNNEEVYSIRDLNLAATLMTLNFYMTGVDFQIEGDKGRPVGYFSFKDSKELQEIVQKYWQGELSVEPRTFTTNLRSLKAQVSNIYNGPRVDMSKMKRT